MGGRLDTEPPLGSEDICIVLISPKFDGNIGAVARSMLNFGIRDLRIVGRDGEWSDETRNRAKHAQGILDSCSTFESIADATDDCSMVVGTSGKREIGDKISFRHFVLPEELPRRLVGVSGKVAFIFGPEDIGLTNEQLHECDILVTIPTWEGYPILNLSHAVSIVCYAWFVTSTKHEFREAETMRLLDPDLRDRLRSEISRLTESMPTKEHKREGIEETLLRVVMRGLPKDDEIHRILSVISEAADAFESAK
jgi:TrmH family RNA methyltransferase